MKPIILSIIKVAKKLFYNTPVHRSKFVNVVYEKLFHAAYGKDGTVTVKYQGASFVVPTRDITILPSLLNDDYETLEFQLLQKVLRRGMTFVDVGANIGLFSIVAARQVGPQGKVYGFEPEPGNFELLKQNIEANNAGNVRIFQSAVGEAAGKMELHIEPNSIGTHSLLNRNPGTTQHNIVVDVVTLDAFCVEHKVRPDVLKIDVEGYEPYVLGGATATLQNVKYLLFEYTKADVQAHMGIDQLIDILVPFPYLYGIDTRRQRVYRFNPRDFNNHPYLNILASKEEISV